MNTSVGSNQGFRSGGNKDQKTKEQEKQKNPQGGNSSKQGNQQYHHHNSNHNVNQQNRKKDNKFQSQNQNRGGFQNNYHHHQQNEVKSTGFPSNTSLNSAGTISVSPTPVVPHVSLESKTVQTERKEKPKREDKSSPFKKTDPKEMDTVMAFKEHDEWNKVELMCELLYLLSPTDLRLVMNCIEGAIRCYTNQMRPVEKTSNSNDPTACLPQYICAIPPTSAYPSGVPDPMHQRAIVGIFSHQPPGLPPLMPVIPSIVMQNETNYNHPSSSTTPSASSSSNKESQNGTNTNTNTGGSNTPTDGIQSEGSITTAKTGNLTSPTTTPEPDSATPISTITNVTPSPTPQSQPPVPQEPEIFLKSVRDLTSYLYTLMSVCTSTNRKSAAKISDYVKHVIIREKEQILSKIPNELDKIDVLQDIGKIIAAMTHHPAVCLDDKMKYADMRDGLRAEIDNIYHKYYSKDREDERKQMAATINEGVGSVEEDDDSEEEDEDEFDIDRRFGNSGSDRQRSTAPGTFFITRFIGRFLENDNLFSLEIHWSDGDCTFAQRTKDQLKRLQHRLLDEFGQQRSEKSHHGTERNSFDDENKKLSTSTSTMETSFAPSGERIVPRLARDATPAQYVQYINELSDLPARMMLSAVICEEFNGTRLRTEDFLQESRNASDGLIFSRWKNPRAKSPVRYFNRNATGAMHPIELPINIPPLLYSTIHPHQLQTLFPSCSNCAGNHIAKMCDKPTLLDKKALVDHKMRSDPEGAINSPPSSSQHGNSHSPYPPMHPQQMQHHVYIDQGMIGPNHFPHQQQHMIQNAIFHHQGQFRPNGQYENQMTPLVYYQAAVPNPNPSNNGNGGRGGGGSNSNSNF